MKKKIFNKHRVVLCSLALASTMIAGCGTTNQVPNATNNTAFDIISEAVEVGTSTGSVNTNTNDTTLPTSIAVDGANAGVLGAGHASNLVNTTTQNIVTNSNIYNSSILLDNLYMEDKGNVLISPLSFNIALSMLSEGSLNDTKTMLENYLSSDNYSEIAKYYYELTDESIQSSNSIWVQNEYTLNEDYNELMHSKYGVDSFNVDFAQSSDAVNKINNWSDEKTHGLIPKILKETDVDAGTLSVLVNSLYFNSEWLVPWENKGEQTFYNIDGSKTDVQFIAQKVDGYYENEQAVAFSYYYKNGLKFIGILPDVDDATTDFSLEALNIEDLLASPVPMKDVNVSMPVLHESYNSSFVDALKQMGMEDLFNGNAQIFGIVQDQNLIVSQIVQSCRLDLDENSTTAAASTAIVSTKSVDMNDKTIKLNRPYVYLIYDETTNQILFMGKVVSFE